MNEPMSLREIANELGVTHQTVSEILARAIKKVRKILDQKGISHQDLL